MNHELIETLRLAQRFGFFGTGPIQAAVEHSSGFIEALGDLAPAVRLIDLGTGGGLPGLVLADHYRAVDVTLLDRRQKRTDFLELAVSRLDLTNVTVRCADVEMVIKEVATGVTARYDAVTARSFGPPAVTLRAAAALVTPEGQIVISEPPAGDRWSPALLDELGLVGERVGVTRRFRSRPG